MVDKPPKQFGDSWSERAALSIARRIPVKIAMAPERGLVNAACIFIGISALSVPLQPQGLDEHELVATWPLWFTIEWGLAMSIGGVLATYGFLRESASAARVGMLLILCCSLIYASGLVWHFGFTKLPSAIIFLGIACAKAVRLIVDSGYRTHLLQIYRGKLKVPDRSDDDLAD